MNRTDSRKLLREYADHGDETAFCKLVEQYVDLVFSVALRRVAGDADFAKDIAQTVFTDLARKASSLRGVRFLGGWLHRHTCFVASNMLRSEQRRQVREQEAAQMNATQNSPDSLWTQLTPMLDDTIESLEAPDRQAILLRFFERQDFRSIGAALGGVSDDAAQKRVSRALEKLRALLAERGVTLSVILLSGLLAGRAIAAAPAGLAGNMAQLALSGAGAGAGLGLTLLGMTKSPLFIIILVGTAAAMAFLAHWEFRSVHPARLPREQLQPIATIGAEVSAPRPASESSPASSIPGSNNVATTNGVLLLNIVAADVGRPIPNVEVDYWIRKNDNTTQNRQLEATRYGVCKVPVPDDISELELISQSIGFATTRLDWRPDHGEQIPAAYTLKMERAVLVGGEVVDPDGNPVAGANVHFEPRPPAPESRPQSDDFPFNFDATTDARGHWQIYRIGQEPFGTIHGDAAHPDFVASPFLDFGNDPEAETQLLAGTYVFHLNRAVVVSGVVLDANGQPVANADVLVGNAPGEFGARKTKTGNDGTFSVAGCQPGDNLITAQAAGLAAKSIAVDLSDNNCGPFQLTLNPGKVLKLRVVDEDSNPVPDANVMLLSQPDVPESSDSAPSAPRIRFKQQTDSEGRMEWDSAPDAELTFLVSAPDYMVKRGVKAQPDGIEHVITLEPALTVSGTVADAATGQPIPRFRVVAGWPTHVPTSGPNDVEDATKPHWSPFERDWMAFGKGKFEFTYQTPMVIGEPNPDYMFKFEADGYRPFVTGVISATARYVRIDVALAPAATTEVTVLTPEHQVAAGVQIGLVSEGAGLVLIPGGFSRQTIDSATATSLCSTDDRGNFALPPDPAITEIVAADAQGYAEATPAELAANPVINLAPWGRLEGTFLSNGVPLVGSTLSIEFGQGQGMNTISCGFHFQATTDAQGRFVFTQAPTGIHNVGLVTPFTARNGLGGWSQTPLQSVTISSDQITGVTIDTTNLFLPQFGRGRPGIGGDN
ncbi:MAG TPA: sigma-70 family RNA polymerase sigma factor [Verrucomicrobiae bacterium]|nr:sigma-70 family RNA polymerase sigma factor [Verrucomicrobiae bacterium]